MTCAGVVSAYDTGTCWTLDTHSIKSMKQNILLIGRDKKNLLNLVHEVPVSELLASLIRDVEHCIV